MKLYEDIIKLTPYLVSIRIIENVITIDISFPTMWKIPKKYVDENSVVENESSDKDFRFFSFVCEMSQDNFNNIYNSIINIIKYNKEREEKENLFQLKVNELKSVFEKQTLDELKKLKIGLDESNTKTKVNKVTLDEETK